MKDLLRDFRSAKDSMAQLQGKMTRIIGEEAVKVVKQNFDLQGYDTGQGIHAWPKRHDVTNQAYDHSRENNATRIHVSNLIKKGTTVGKRSRVIRGKSYMSTPTGRISRATNKTYKGSTYHGSNPLLLQTRTLYRSITYFPHGKGVTIGVDPGLVIYAQKMNEGGAGKWGKVAKTNTPARQYMPRPGQPPNPKILRAITSKVKYEQDKAMAAFKK